ncbi:MAG TPA: hypothetical protein P5234_00500 [Thermoanaerobaculaceae bacterium]|nr:hypothetical protein [Thermoanaerobaculaceae bacterium]HRS14707.1 hypothetical protein [Thermoanaerobaculaceae bacterium]
MSSRAAVLLFVLAVPAPAAPVRFFTLDTPRALAGAISQGVAVLPDGTLQALPPLQVATEFEEPLGLALAVTPRGVAYVGTGHPARVWKVEGSRKSLVGEPPAEQVTGLALDETGTLYVATALPALLLEMRPGAGTLSEVARLEGGSIWDLALWRGSLWAAAGDPGRVLRLGRAGWEVAFTVPDRHARCLEPAGDELYVGTSGKGLVLRWGGRGAAVVLYDSPFTEVADLQLGNDGLLYASGLTGDPTLGTPARADGEATVTVSEGASSTPQTEKGPATSEIVKVYPTGAAVPVHRFTRQVAGPLGWSEAGLVAGTTVEGELWQLADGVPARLDTVDASAVARIAGTGDWVLTVGPVALLRRQGMPRGTFVSPPLDAQQPAAWGLATLEGQLPPGKGCRQSFRSGPTAEPGETWSDWSAPAPCGEVRAEAPPARYLQVRVELEAATRQAPRLGRVAIAYRQLNLPPIVKELVAHPPGEVFLKGPPPSERVVEVQHPDLSGIFTVLDEEDQERQQTLGRKYYRVGYQSLSWKAEDPNGDPLRFSLEIQRQGSDAWWLVRKELETLTLAFDTTALADGRYRFRLTASDAAANPDAPASAQALSSWVTVDTTPPRLQVRRDGSDWVFEVEDALSPIAIMEWNRDAQGWQRAACEDGMLDSRRETLRVPAAPGVHVLTVRAVDDHHNSAALAVEER